MIGNVSRAMARRLGLLCLVPLLGWMFCTCQLSGDSGQILYGNGALHLDQLGLSLRDLDWGQAVGGVRIAALFVPTPAAASTSTSNDQVTFIFAIENHAQAGLGIPTVNALPHYFVYGPAEPRKELFHYSEAYSIGSPSHEILPAGQTIIYTRNYSISGLQKRNEQQSPMIFVLKDAGPYNSPSQLYLESREVPFPKLP